MKKPEQHGMEVASFLQGGDWVALLGIIQGTGLTDAQVKNGMQWFRRVGGVELGYTIVCDKRTDTYALCDEFGNPVSARSLSGYDVALSRDRASRSMTGYTVSLTAYNRANIDGDAFAVATYRKRVRGFRNVLESFAEEADRIGDTQEHDRIEMFLAANAI